MQNAASRGGGGGVRARSGGPQNQRSDTSAMSGQAMSKQQLAETAYEIETGRLEAPIGKQDQYAAAFGGLNCFEFTADGVRVTPLRMNGSTSSGPRGPP